MRRRAKVEREQIEWAVPGLDVEVATLEIALLLLEERGMLNGRTRKSAREIIESLTGYSRDAKIAVLEQVIRLTRRGRIVQFPG